MAVSYITEEQKQQIYALARKGLRQKQIIEQVGLKPHVVIHQIKNYRKGKSIVKNEVKKFIRRPAVQTTVQAPSKPMIALLGSPDEVTKTIKELFS